MTEHTDLVEYVILDDDKTILEEQMSRFVKTELTIGMLKEHYYHARKILLGQQPK